MTIKMYSLKLKCYVNVLSINMIDRKVIYWNPHKGWLQSDSIYNVVSKNRWEAFLVFYYKWKNLKEKPFNAPKIHAGTRKGKGKKKDKMIFFLSCKEDNIGNFNIYDTYEEAEEALKIFVYENYYQHLSEAERKELLNFLE